MKFKNFFEMQKELDDYIVSSKKLQNKEQRDMISHMFCGLFSEILEATNEMSKDNTCITDTLEELIDVFHFLLSVGYRSGIDNVIGEIDPLRAYNGVNNNIYTVTIDLMDSIKAYKVWSNKPSDELHVIATKWLRVFNWIYLRVLGIGCKWTQAEVMYVAKWKENKDRQDRGY